MVDGNKFHWAKKVSQRDIRRLYESDAKGQLDVELLDEVLFSIQARVQDMFEVREAQNGREALCRNCGAVLSHRLWMGSANRQEVMACPKCGWQTTCGEYLASYTGKDMLPGSRTELFHDFIRRLPQACTPQEKMLLVDWLIHEFHVQSGVSSRLVAMNIIQGSRDQLIGLLTELAGSEMTEKNRVTWVEKENDPIRQFRRKYPSRAKVQDVAEELKIRGRTRMPENELIAEILRRAPELMDD